MGASASRLTNSLFWSVFIGAPLKEIDDKIAALKNELSDEEQKLFKLSALRETGEGQITSNKNLLMVSCLCTGGDDAAATSNRLAFMRKYLTQFDVNEVADDKTKETCLFLACNPRQVDFEIEGSPDGHDKPRRCLDPTKTDTLSADIVELLLAEGADATMNQFSLMTHDAANSDGDMCTPLHIAARFGFSAAVDELIARGANASLLSTASRRTALHFAAHARSVKCVTSILAVLPRELRDAEDASKGTALHYAASYSTAEVIEALIINGCDFGTKYDFYAHTATTRDDDRGQIKVLLRERSSACRTQFFGRYSDKAFVKNFYEAAGISDAVDSVGNFCQVVLANRNNSKPTLNPALAAYPVVQACILCNFDILRLLLQQGYKINQPCPLLPNGITPLHIIVGIEGTPHDNVIKTTFSRFVPLVESKQLNSVFDAQGRRPHVYNMSAQDVEEHRFSSNDPLKTALFLQVITEQREKQEIAANDKVIISGAYLDGEARRPDGFGSLADSSAASFITSFGTDYNYDITSKTLNAGLPKFTNLERLTISAIQCEDAAVSLAKHLAKSCTYLDLASCSILEPEKSLELLSSISQLRTLNISGNHQSFLSEFLGKKDLLNPKNSIVNDTTILHLLNLTHLEELNLSASGPALTKDGLRNFAKKMKEMGRHYKKLDLSLCDSWTKPADQDEVALVFDGVVDEVITERQVHLHQTSQ